MSNLKSILKELTAGKSLPDGCDSWGLKSTRDNLTTLHGYRWPSPGGWATVPDIKINRLNTGPCPSHEGDGLCVADTFVGMASGGFSAKTMLLVAYSSDDILGEGKDKVRLKKVHVVEQLSGEGVVREYGSEADLYGADLQGESLHGAKLFGADLRGADLHGASLAGADLHNASLIVADLHGADLTGADLTGASLYGADLHGASLAGADLREADLREANLYRADLTGASLGGAKGVKS